MARIRGMLGVGTCRVAGVTFRQGFAGGPFNLGNVVFGTNHHDIYWRGVKDPLNVLRPSQEKVAAFQEIGANQATYNEAGHPQGGGGEDRRAFRPRRAQAGSLHGGRPRDGKLAGARVRVYRLPRLQQPGTRPRRLGSQGGNRLGQMP